jgi:hypothetical protein
MKNNNLITLFFGLIFFAASSDAALQRSKQIERGKTLLKKHQREKGYFYGDKESTERSREKEEELDLKERLMAFIESSERADSALISEITHLNPKFVKAIFHKFAKFLDEKDPKGLRALQRLQQIGGVYGLLQEEPRIQRGLVYQKWQYCLKTFVGKTVEKLSIVDVAEVHKKIGMIEGQEGEIWEVFDKNHNSHFFSLSGKRSFDLSPGTMIGIGNPNTTNTYATLDIRGERKNKNSPLRITVFEIKEDFRILDTSLAAIKPESKEGWHVPELYGGSPE